MKLVEIWKTRSTPTVSFELFPARSEKAQRKLGKAIDKMTALGPDFVSVTFGAGGSTRKGSYELIRMLKEEKGLEVLPYFACYGLDPDEVISVLDGYADLGVHNILTVRGDPPEDDDFTPHHESFEHASDLIKFIRPRYDLCIGAAGYPEGHIAAQSREKDVEFLKLKVTNGAEFIIANYFYDNAFFADFMKRVRESGIQVPVLPGVMPIYNVKMMHNLAKLCGATITDEVRDGISALPEGDKDALNEFGIEFATKQCIELLEQGVPGLHFYTMDRAKSVKGIVGNLRKQGLL